VGAKEEPAAGTATAPVAAAPAAADTAKRPTWIIQICGYHYHNADRTNQGAPYVRNTLIKALREKTVTLGAEKVSMKDLGISLPVLVNPLRVYDESVTDPNAEAAGGAGGGPAGLPQGGAMGRAAAADNGVPVANEIKLQRFDFVVQFCWQPKTPLERRKAAKEKEAKEALEKANAPAQPANNKP
jgi:hypothetical protein